MRLNHLHMGNYMMDARSHQVSLKFCNTSPILMNIKFLGNVGVNIDVIYIIFLYSNSGLHLGVME